MGAMVVEGGPTFVCGDTFVKTSRSFLICVLLVYILGRSGEVPSLGFIDFCPQVCF